MRVLVISNLYPPHYLGGYELGCQQVVDRLRDSGHTVNVLTSTFGGEVSTDVGGTIRGLTFKPTVAGMGTLSRALKREVHDSRVTRRSIDCFRPEIVLVFSLHGVPHGILKVLDNSGLPVVYAFSSEWLLPGFENDPWLEFWRRPASTAPKRVVKGILKKLLSTITWTGSGPLDLKFCFFTSRRLHEIFLEKGLAVESGTVIRWGVDLDRFHPRENGSTDWGPRLLFAGRVVQEKGFLTVVDAVDLLVHDHRLTSLKCTVAGPSHDTGYLEEVHQRIRRAQLESYFSFVGEVAVDNMPDLYRRHDVFLLPSLWEEPFSIGLLEAMATGLAVIATATGGTPEILQDGVNGLFFEAGSARDLASKIVALDCNEHLRRQLASSAHTTIEEGFSIERMVDQVENLLIDLSPRNASA